MTDHNAYIGNYEDAILCLDSDTTISFPDLIKRNQLTGFGHNGYWIVDVHDIAIQISKVCFDWESMNHDYNWLQSSIINCLNLSVIEEVSHALGESHKGNSQNWILMFLECDVI